MKIIIGRLIFETYMGITNKKVYSIGLKNKHGGSLQYADTFLIKAIYIILLQDLIYKLRRKWNEINQKTS